MFRRVSRGLWRDLVSALPGTLAMMYMWHEGRRVGYGEGVAATLRVITNNYPN